MARRPSPRSRKGYSKLNSELVAVRGRGLAHIDEYRGSLTPLADIETLVELAKVHTAAEPGLRRGERIERLITDAVPLMERPDHRRRVTLLFGLGLGNYESATKLRKYANKELNEEHLSDSARVRRDRAAFGSLETAIEQLLASEQEPLAVESDTIITTLQALVSRIDASLREPRATGPQRVPFMAREDVPFFVGREEELEVLRQATEERTSVVLHGLYGMGGVGKTSLAIRFAHQYRTLFPDGILWAQLDKSSISAILFSFAQAYDRERDITELPDLEDRILFVESLLAGRQALAVLDNAKSSKQVEPLLRATAGISVVVTTRSKNLAALRNAQVVSVGPLPRPVALDLLRRILGVARVEQEPTAAAELCRLTGYLPLALRIAAQRIKASNYTLVDYVERLKQRRALNELRLGWERTKDTDVRASFDLSYSDLDAPLQSFFASLGTFVNSDFELAAAAHVTDLDSETVDRNLEFLHELSLIEPGSPGRWRLHPLLQEYASERIADASVHQRMADYFVALTEKADAALRGPEQTTWLERLDQESANIERAYTWALDNDRHDQALQLLGALAWYWSTRGRQQDTCARLKELLAEGDTLPRDVRSKAASTACQMAADLGNFTEARQWADLALDLARQLGDVRAIANVLAKAASVAWCQGEYVEARELATESLDISKSIDDPTGVATGWNVLGLISAYEGSFSEAARLYRKSLALRRKNDDTWGIATSLNNLGEVLRCQGKLDEAADHYSQALRMRLEMEDKWSIANSLNNAGELLRHKGRLDLATVYYRTGLRLTRQIGNCVGIATSLAGLAGIAAARRQFTRAARLIGASEARLEKARTRLGPANYADYPDIVKWIRQALGSKAYWAAHVKGAELDDDDIVAYALKGASDD